MLLFIHHQGRKVGSSGSLSSLGLAQCWSPLLGSLLVMSCYWLVVAGLTWFGTPRNKNQWHIPVLLGLFYPSDIFQIPCWRLVVAMLSFWVSDVRQLPFGDLA